MIMIECPYCYCYDTIKNGHRVRRNGNNRAQVYRCNGCGRKFTRGKRPDVITKKIGKHIMDLHSDGHSSRQIRKSIIEFDGVKMSHTTIWRYIRDKR